MSKELVAFLSGFDCFTTREIETLSEMMTVKIIAKNTSLVNEGQVCNLCYFVLKGCLRQYILRDGIDKTISFYTEHQSINFFTSAVQQTPATSNLVALEDSILLIGNPENDQRLYARFPVLHELTRKMMEEDFGKTQDSFAKFMTSSAEERYLNLIIERPNLLQRVPQNQLASYLGVTPESLSRIRKRVMLK